MQGFAALSSDYPRSFLETLTPAVSSALIISNARILHYRQTPSVGKKQSDRSLLQAVTTRKRNASENEREKYFPLFAFFFICIDSKQISFSAVIDIRAGTSYFLYWAGLSCSLWYTNEDRAVFLRFLEKWWIHIDAVITPQWKIVILNTEGRFLRSVLAQSVCRTGPLISEQQQRKVPPSEELHRLTSLPSQGPTEHPCAGRKHVSMLAVFKVSWLAKLRKLS